VKKIGIGLLVLSSLLSSSAFALGNKLVRMRALTVMPDADGKPTLIGGKVKIDNQSIPELDLSYFFNDNFAAELILGTTTHSVQVHNASGSNHDLGNVTLLPPTLMAQYHHTFDKFKPYVGAGLNYTMFFNQGTGAHKSIDYTNSLGYGAQVGFDYALSENVYFNFDVKKLWLSTDVTVKTYAGATVKADVDINPLLVGFGVGYRF